MTRIGLDVDEVTCKTLERCLSLLNEALNTNYTTEIFHEWDIWSCLPKKEADMLKDIFVDSIIWDNMLPPSDAQAIVKQMVLNGDEVFFVSNCDERTHEWKSNWLCRVYPFVPRENHIYIAQKKLLLLDYIIDDNVDWIRGSVATRILIDKPWNVACKSGFDYRAKTLSNAWDIICDLEKESD